MYDDMNPLAWIATGGKNSLRTFGAYMLKDSSRGTVAKRTNFFTVPFSNYPLKNDYTEIYGEPTYETRQLKYNFRLICEDNYELHKKYMDFANWIAKTTDNKLFDSEYPEFYFTAKCSGVSELRKISMSAGDFTVTFNSNPFRTSIDYGVMAFDKINLETDCINPDVISVEINSSTIRQDPSITVYNYGSRPICPRLSFDDLGESMGLDVVITPIIAANGISHFDTDRAIETRVSRKDTRLFTNEDFILYPGRSFITLPLDSERNFGKLTINMFEEVL